MKPCLPHEHDWAYSHGRPQPGAKRKCLRCGLVEDDVLRNYRCTLPDRYSEKTQGHTDPLARQGHYTFAATPEEARIRVRAELKAAGNYVMHGERDDDGERIDVQLWEGR